MKCMSDDNSLSSATDTRSRVLVNMVMFKPSWRTLWHECICVVNKHNSLENSIRWWQYHRLLGWSKAERLNSWSDCSIYHRSLSEHLGSMILHHDLLGWVTLMDCMAILIGRTGQGAVSQRHFSLKLFTWSLQSHHRCSSTSLYDVLLALFHHF